MVQIKRSHARLFREAPRCWLKPRGCKEKEIDKLTPQRPLRICNIVIQTLRAVSHLAQCGRTKA